MRNIPLSSLFDTQSLPYGQQCHMLITHLVQHADTYGGILIHTIQELLDIYHSLIHQTSYRYAIADVHKRIGMHESSLQQFRKILDDHNIKTRIICKYADNKYELSGLYNREVKTVSPQYLLSQYNIDIVGEYTVILTGPDLSSTGLVFHHPEIHDVCKELFEQFWSIEEHTVGLQPGDEQSTASWISIMKSGTNYGIDYVINPVLYPAIFTTLPQDMSVKMIDCGSGINTLGQELLYANPAHIPGLSGIPNLPYKRQRIESLTGFEANQQFVTDALQMQHDLQTEHIHIVRKELVSGHKLPYHDNSIDRAVSRNFIVHLGYEDFEHHLSEVARVLSDGGLYIIATLNPAYENAKYHSLTGLQLEDGQRYNHYHGKSGEWGTWTQYYKERSHMESCFAKYFHIQSVQSCMPINDDERNTRPLYYNPDCPMALVYVLQK